MSVVGLGLGGLIGVILMILLAVKQFGEGVNVLNILTMLIEAVLMDGLLERFMETAALRQRMPGDFWI